MKNSIITLIAIVGVTTTLFGASAEENTFDNKCSMCHSKNMPKDMSSIIAPPLNGVMRHLKMTYPNKKDAVAFVVDYVQNPSKDKAICMPQKLKRFGVMPSQKGNITPAELEKVAGWMFDNYPTANFRGHGMGMKSGGGMQSSTRMKSSSMFAMIDTNGNGKITPDEFATFQKSRMGRQMGGMGKSGMRTMQNRTIFPDMDLNKDGVITKDEFLKVRETKQAQRASQGMPMRNASKAPSFESIDSNGDGKITPDEFNRVVKFGQKNLPN